MLVSGLMIFFPVVRGGSTVGVCGEFVEFGSSLVRVIWHRVCHPRRPFQLRILLFFGLFNSEQQCFSQRRPYLRSIWDIVEYSKAWAEVSASSAGDRWNFPEFFSTAVHEESLQLVQFSSTQEDHGAPSVNCCIVPCA
jgi:hypothetical protein